MTTMTAAATDVQRDYIKEYSQSLGRDMEVLHFGHAGTPLLVFPTSMGRFYQWEDFGLVAALSDFIESGAVQLVCVDSVDGESWYAKDRPPADRVRRHLEYEAYIVDEILPRIPDRPVACGTSFGALHAVLLAARHPTRVGGVIGPRGAPRPPQGPPRERAASTPLPQPQSLLPRPTDAALLVPLPGAQPPAIPPPPA